MGGEIHLSNCITAERAYLYVARGLTSVAPAPDGTEVLRIKKVPFVEALEAVESGEIKDGMTIIAILRLDRLLRTKRPL